MRSNFFPIEFHMSSFEVQRVPFDRDRLKHLRASYNSNCSFFRNSDHIYVSPSSEESPTETESVTIPIDENPAIVESMIRHLFFRSFRERYADIIPTDFHPFRFISRKETHNQISNSAKDQGIDAENLINCISKRRVVEIQFRHIVCREKTIFGALINISNSWVYGAGVTCTSLKKDGLDLIGREVMHVTQIAGLDGVMMPEESLVGTVLSIDTVKNVAKIDSNSGVLEIGTDVLLPNKNPENIDAIVKLYLGENDAQRIRSATHGNDPSLTNAGLYYNEVTKIANLISTISYRNFDNFTFTISNTPFTPSNSLRLEAPNFKFDYAPGASNINASHGLSRHGPYDSQEFAPKAPRIAILCQGIARDAFTSFLGKLRDGIPETTNFPGGMRGKYRLNDILFDASVDFIEATHGTAEEYDKLASDYLRKTDESRRADLVLIHTSDAFKSRSVTQNPYFIAKSRFMMAGVPSQGVKVESIRTTVNSLKYIIDSVALQIYAKLGGTPFVLSAGSNTDKEIVIGIGHAVSRTNRFHGNLEKRIVGITTFFKADGEYILGGRSREVTYEEYFEELLENLRISIKGVASSYGWRTGDAVRLVIHIFKPIRNIEVDVVDKLVAEYPQYNLTYAFVTVTDRHPFLMFDERQSGRGKKKLGEYVPSRQTTWVLDEHCSLVQLSGHKETLSIVHRFSGPVLIRIHDKSTYRDLHAISQQVFNFSALSWRSFKPSRTPATIGYANLISEKLASLRQLDGWNSDALSQKAMRNKKWFL